MAPVKMMVVMMILMLLFQQHINRPAKGRLELRNRSMYIKDLLYDRGLYHKAMEKDTLFNR